LAPNVQQTRPIEILMVEDNPLDVTLAFEALEDAKIWNRIVVAKDGVEAWNELSQRKSERPDALPDLILLDLNLPKMNGRELLSKMSEDARLRLIPVIVLTASSRDEDVLMSYELKAKGYITKPIDSEQLLKVVGYLEDFGISIVRVRASTA